MFHPPTTARSRQGFVAYRHVTRRMFTGGTGEATATPSVEPRGKDQGGVTTDLDVVLVDQFD